MLSLELGKGEIALIRLCKECLETHILFHSLLPLQAFHPQVCLILEIPAR